MDHEIRVPGKRSRRSGDGSRDAPASQKHPANEARQRVVSDTIHLLLGR